MFNLITHKINNERSDYLYTHFLLETNGAAPFFLYTIDLFQIRHQILHCDKNIRLHRFQMFLKIIHQYLLK